MLKFWDRTPAVASDDTDRIPERIAWAAVPRWRLLAVLLLSLFNAGVCAVLLLQHHGDPTASAAVSQVCGEGGNTGCEVVARSPYSTVRGVPLAAVGLAFSLSAALLSLLGVIGGPDTRASAALLLLALFALAVLAAVVLFGIQLVLIKAFCKLCVLTYAIDALALMILLPTRRDRAALRGGMRYPEARVAFTGWVAGTVAVAAAVLAGNAALASRRNAAADASLLGTSAAPTPALRRRARGGRRAALPGGGARGPRAGAPAPGDPRRPAQARGVLRAEGGARVRAGAGGTPSTSRARRSRGRRRRPSGWWSSPTSCAPIAARSRAPSARTSPPPANRVVLYFKNYPLEQACNPGLSRTIHPGACALALGGDLRARPGQVLAVPRPGVRERLPPTPARPRSPRWPPPPASTRPRSTPA